jgi:hypothetical protein
MSDIICRWRDAVTDPPPAGWHGLIRELHADGCLVNEWYYRDPDDRRAVPSRRYVTQWLDITDIPAIPRAKVQAAVDEIASDEKQYDDVFEPEIAGGLEMARNAIFNHTGVTPTEVQP